MASAEPEQPSERKRRRHRPSPLDEMVRDDMRRVARQERTQNILIWVGAFLGFAGLVYLLLSVVTGSNTLPRIPSSPAPLRK